MKCSDFRTFHELFLCKAQVVARLLDISWPPSVIWRTSKQQGVTMRKILFAFVLSAAASANANLDPFESASCVGPTMSAQRALELLGNQFSRELAGPDKIVAVSRQRQKLSGIIGQWYSATHGVESLEVRIANVNSELVLNVGYFRTEWQRGSRHTYHYEMICSPPDSASPHFTCTPIDQQPMFHGPLAIVLTDNCFRAFTSKIGLDHDQEWVYLAQF